MCVYIVSKSCLTFVTSKNIALQDSLSMGFPRQEYWSGLLFPRPGDHPDPGIELMSPVLQVDSIHIYRYLSTYSSILAWKSHGQKSLLGCSPWGCEELDMVEAPEWLHFHFSLSRNGEGNGKPPQCSCLENPRDCGAWLAAVYGVAQSQTRLKRLGSSSSSITSSPTDVSISISPQKSL